MVNSDSRFTCSQQPIKAALGPRSQSGLNHQNQLSTINQSQLGLNGNSVNHNSPSPPGSKSTTPSPSSSAHEDDNDDGLRVNKTNTHSTHKCTQTQNLLTVWVILSYFTKLYTVRYETTSIDLLCVYKVRDCNIMCHYRPINWGETSHLTVSCPTTKHTHCTDTASVFWGNETITAEYFIVAVES